MKIISELVPAFTSSIVGLLCALGATVLTKYKFAKEEALEDSKLQGRTPEEYIRDISVSSKNIEKHSDLLKENNDLLGKLIKLGDAQEKKHKEYNDNLNKNISHQSKILQEFIDGFVKRMDGIFQQMRGAIQQQVMNFGEEQFSKTSELLASITERLSNVSNDIINCQKQSVEQMMTSTNTEIGNITIKVTEALDNLTKDLQAEYEKVQEHNVQSLQQMVDLRTAYQEATNSVLTSTLNMNEKATSDLRESMVEFTKDIQQSVTNQCNALANSISENVESLNNAYKFIESLVAEIRQNYDQAVLAYGDAVNVAHRTNESAEKTITAANESLKSVEETNEKIAEVITVLTERQENIEILIKQISSVSAAIVDLQRLESVLNKITSK